jgi:hypothetical protein
MVEDKATTTLPRWKWHSSASAKVGLSFWPFARCHLCTMSSPQATTAMPRVGLPYLDLGREDDIDKPRARIYLCCTPRRLHGRGMQQTLSPHSQQERCLCICQLGLPPGIRALMPEALQGKASPLPSWSDSRLANDLLRRQ